MVHREAADECGHDVLEGQADKLHAVSPPEHLFEELAQPADELAFAGAGDPMNQIKQGLALCGVSSFVTLFVSFLLLNAAFHGSQEIQLLLRRGVLFCCDSGKPCFRGGGVCRTVELSLGVALLVVGLVGVGGVPRGTRLQVLFHLAVAKRARGVETSG